jgi:hypothetical protein
MTAPTKKLIGSFHALLGRVEVGIIPNYVQSRRPTRVSYLYGVKNHYEVGPRNLNLLEKKSPLIESDQFQPTGSELSRAYAQLKYFVDDAVSFERVGAADIPSKAPARVRALLEDLQEEMHVVAFTDIYSGILYAKHGRPMDFEIAAMKFKGAAGVFDYLGEKVLSLLVKELAASMIDKIRVSEDRPELHALSDQLNSSIARGWLGQLSDQSDPAVNALAMYQGMSHALYSQDWECAIKLLEHSMSYFVSVGYQRFAMKDKLRIAWVLLQEGSMEKAAGHMKEVASSWGKMGVHKRYVRRLEQLARDILEDR